MSVIIFLVPVLLAVSSWFLVKYLTRNLVHLDGARRSIWAMALFMFVAVQLWHKVLHQIVP
jgi:hypothetical protein